MLLHFLTKSMWFFPKILFQWILFCSPIVRITVYRQLAKGVMWSSSCGSGAGRWTYDSRMFYRGSTCSSAAHLWSSQRCHLQLRRRQHHDPLPWHVRHPHPPDIASYSQPPTIFINDHSAPTSPSPPHHIPLLCTRFFHKRSPTARVPVPRPVAAPLHRPVYINMTAGQFDASWHFGNLVVCKAVLFHTIGLTVNVEIIIRKESPRCYQPPYRRFN